jgi:hypothetical protein
MKKGVTLMHKTFTQCLSIIRLGKRDEIVREKGSNNDDGWGYTILPDNDRIPVPTRKKRK